MRNQELVFAFKNIGPIKKNGKIKNSDITLIYGYPNSGKSFILRALYSALSVIDKEMEDSIKNFLEENLSILILKSLGNSLSKIIETFMEVIDTTLHFYDLTPRNLVNSVPEDELNKVLLSIIKENVHHIEFESSENGILYTFKDQVTIPIYIDSINKNLKNSFFRFLSNIIGGGSIKTLKINGERFDNLLESEIRNLSYNSVNGNFAPRAEHLIGSIDRTRIVYEFKTNLIYSIPEISTKSCIINIDAQILIKKINNVHKNIKSNIDNNEKIDQEALRNQVISKIKSNKRQGFYIFSLREIPEGLSKSISKTIVEYFIIHIHSLVKTYSKINEVRFIPFGRTPLINYSFLKNDQNKSREDLQNDSMQNIYNTFIKWIKYTETKIITENKPFLKSPIVMQGDISYDKITNRLFYTDRNNFTVDIRYASAMANEVAGIVLISLSMEEGLIIIEEPESQLHPSSQIIMALTLIDMASSGKRIVFSTHSNMLGQIFYLLHKYKPSPRQIQNLIDDVINTEYESKNEEAISDLAFSVSKALDYVEFDSYYVDKVNAVREINLEKFGNGIPGITDEVLMKLLNWTGKISEDE
ncbi:AAA family ATPase [Cuniculiplasma sp. SKW4]|uniref:AAA family ATPase n=1 Tax=Cuniculiplasma sp. SKW4 TaxID=3400171 RepID=UPI003FD3857D